MKHAKILNSPRLQRVLKALREVDGEISSWGIASQARVCGLSAAISELRANGVKISCRLEVQEDGRRIWWYKLDKSPETTTS